ncbi:MAG TPA: hypothetical protein VEU51_03750 [Candidatus Acidoferrales bacterium]|nr:hypothetical protein [Candidatus Acidoferrales bacterium]
MTVKAFPQIPDTPAGRQLEWYLERVVSGGVGASEAELDARCTLNMMVRAPFPYRHEVTSGGWQRANTSYGPFSIASIDESSDFAIAVKLQGVGDKRWRLSCTVEPQPPNRISEISAERLLDFEVVSREAVAADAKVLADIERRCPIVLGDGTTMVIDRGDDYFAFTRLMEEFVVALGFVDGKPAGVNAAGIHKVRVDGKDYRILAAAHLRILPEHQKKGVWGKISRVFDQKYPEGSIDGSSAYPSVDNAAMLKGFAGAPKWRIQQIRAQLSCASLAGPRVGRPATPDDAARIVEILNATHEEEEMYLPYTVESFTARMERSPKDYSWQNVWLTDRAVMGVWPAGDTVRFIIESKGSRIVSRRGLALDWGFRAGAEDELEALIRARCGWLQARGLDRLSLFTSEPSPGYARVKAIASELERYVVILFGAPEPPDVATRGVYVDPIYF